jgi:hypothetical protein
MTDDVQPEIVRLGGASHVGRFGWGCWRAALIAAFALRL